MIRTISWPSGSTNDWFVYKPLPEKSRVYRLIVGSRSSMSERPNVETTINCYYGVTAARVYFDVEIARIRSVPFIQAELCLGDIYDRFSHNFSSSLPCDKAIIILWNVVAMLDRLQNDLRFIAILDLNVPKCHVTSSWRSRIYHSRSRLQNDLRFIGADYLRKRTKISDSRRVYFMIRFLS